MSRKKSTSSPSRAHSQSNAAASRASVLGWIVAAVALMVALCVIAWGPTRSIAVDTHEQRGSANALIAGHEVAPAVSTTALLNYCGSCHTAPPPELLPKDRWRRTIENMNAIITQNDLGLGMTPSQVAAVSDWYVQRAPEAYPLRLRDALDSPMQFSPEVFGDRSRMISPKGGPPLIADVRILDLTQDGRLDVLISDVANSALLLAQQSGDGSWHERKLADIAAPAQTCVTDINGNGHLDILVADLGSIEPTDDPIGRVILLMNDGRMSYTPVELVTHLPRVSDVQAADLTGDGRMDIIFASFGLYRAGTIGFLEQQPDGKFVGHELFRRNGTSHVRIADLNDNGLLDIVSLASQEHQEVLAFINRGGGHFERRVLYKAPHLMWGFSSLELVDLDKDGLVDVLLANGDAFDIDFEPKPWHGVQWLRNRGNLEFEQHDLVKFYGAYRAVAVDINRDGHLDVLVPSMVNHWDQPQRQSMIWLENDGRQNFTPRSLADAPTSLITVAADDLTGNGWPDVIAGGLYIDSERAERVGRLTMYKNLGPVAP